LSPAGEIPFPAAATRSGKGVGLVIPTLLTWPGSTIVHDIKGENFQLTSGFRARFGTVLLFDPTNPESAAYNPLLEIRKGDSEVRDAQNIADILVDPEGALERRDGRSGLSWQQFRFSTPPPFVAQSRAENFPRKSKAFSAAVIVSKS
jgi:type IV secretory pathway TraG/TraD family ATPase VirD4